MFKNLEAAVSFAYIRLSYKPGGHCTGLPVQCQGAAVGLMSPTLDSYWIRPYTVTFYTFKPRPNVNM